jgi:hypothetical protein
MANDRHGRLAMIGLAVALVGFVSCAFAGEDAKSAKAATRLPEITRSGDLDDVNGKENKVEANLKAKGAADLTPEQLDALIDKSLLSNKVAASPPTSDEEFLRRVYLDINGKLPTPTAVRQFTASRDPKKRAQLIETLLAHPEFAENWARYWRDVIAYRSPNENPQGVNYPKFEKWMSEQLAQNRPWDKITTDIITATGNSAENGAVAFAMAEEAQAVEMAGEVSRIFMGIQIQCAQCHDHPNDPWKRPQFHGFAAFFAGLRVQGRPKDMSRELVAKGAPQYGMPDLKNPDKKIPVAPQFFLGDAPKISPRVTADQRLVLAAQYVTSVDNPWFARAFINRVWYSLMGEGFYNPVDDLGPTRTPNMPEVLDLLTEQWQRSGYDIRWLFKVVLNTKAYQRQVRATNTAAGRTPFAANASSRLRADQIYDSLAHALNVPNVPVKGFQARPVAKKAGMPGAPVGKAAMNGIMPIEEKAIGEVDRGRDQFEKIFGVDPSTPNDDVTGTIPQALYLMNSDLVTRHSKAKPGTMLGEVLAYSPDNKAVLNVIYLRTLSRFPNAREVQIASHHLSLVGDRAEAFEDILWALLNSTEFLCRR